MIRLDAELTAAAHLPISSSGQQETDCSTVREIVERYIKTTVLSRAKRDFV